MARGLRAPLTPLATEALSDSLRQGLKLVFVGTAAGRYSAGVGTYYAHLGNRFWRTLHEVGLTPRLYRPDEYRSLLDLGIGFTDVAKRAAGMDHQIAPEAFDPKGFAAKVERATVLGCWRPRASARPATG